MVSPTQPTGPRSEHALAIETQHDRRTRNADYIFGFMRMVVIELRSLADNEPEVSRPIRYIADQLEAEAASLRHAAGHIGSASFNAIRAGGPHSSPVALFSSTDRSIKSRARPRVICREQGSVEHDIGSSSATGTDLERMAHYHQQAAQFRQWAEEDPTGSPRRSARYGDAIRRTSKRVGQEPSPLEQQMTE
jgi:hypothetical protein